MRALRRDAHSSLQRACGGGSSTGEGGGEVLEEAEKRKEATVKNRIKGHEKMQIFFFFFSPKLHLENVLQLEKPLG